MLTSAPRTLFKDLKKYIYEFNALEIEIFDLLLNKTQFLLASKKKISYWKNNMKEINLWRSFCKTLLSQFIREYKSIIEVWWTFV